MRVLLVQPNTSTLRGTLCPPIGLMYVAAVARQAGHELKILDRNIDYFSLAQMKAFKPHIVGITSMTGPMLLDAIHVSQQVKQLLGNDTPVVWGGVHASILPEQTLQNDFVDYVVIGEGEYTFLDLLGALENRSTDVSGIEGLAYKHSGGVRINEERPVLRDLDVLPQLPWDLVRARKYLGVEVVLVTSRGCPFSCTFCLSGRQGPQHRYRRFSAGRVIEEIRRIEAMTANRHLKFHDDFFTSDHQYCKSIFDSLSSDYSLLLYTRVTFVDEKFLSLLRRFRRVWLSFGVESGSERMLEKYNKKISIAQVREAFALCHRQKNIRTKASVILGGPTETREETELTLRLMREIDPTRHTYCVYTPYPGSALYDEAVRSHLFVPPGSIEGWAEVTMHEVDPSRTLDIDQDYFRRIDEKGWIVNLRNAIREREWYKMWQRMKDYDPFLIKVFNGIENRLIGRMR